MAFIYKISAKNKSRVYIGSTIDFKKRVNAHLHELKKGTHANKKLQNHVNKYSIEDLIFEILEETTAELLLIREQFYIDTLKPEFNICPTAGGMSGYKQTPESIEKRRQKTTGRTRSFETKKKMSLLKQGIRHSEEHKLKVSLAKKGREVSADTRRKISEAKKGIKRSEACKNAIAIANTGKRHSEQTRKKMSESHKKRLAN